jgi:hypothetical protein
MRVAFPAVDLDHLSGFATMAKHFLLPFHEGVDFGPDTRGPVSNACCQT